MRRPRRARWIGLVAVASAGLLCGCYYPYGGYYYPWGYPPYPYAAGYPYGAANPYPPAPGAAAQYPQQPVPGAPQPLTEPVQRTPLPPAPVP